MKCPECGYLNTTKSSKVLDVRESKNSSVNRRRRQCLKCGYEFRTVERIAGD